MPTILVRDSSYQRDRHAFEELGVLDTIGYIDFSNSDQLANSLAERQPFSALPTSSTRQFTDAPLYVLKGKIDTDGAVRLISTLKKSPLRFRTYDAIEQPRLSYAEARRQVSRPKSSERERGFRGSAVARWGRGRLGRQVRFRLWVCHGGGVSLVRRRGGPEHPNSGFKRVILQHRSGSDN